MICYNGEAVWPEGEGYPELYSIGVALGRIPRFCGHTKHWYPVLGHVLAVAEILPKKAALQGLLHDAPEACMSDVPTPWKTQAARRREYMLLRRIYKGNGLDWPISEDVQELVDDADATMLAAEAHVIGHPKADIWTPPLDEHAAIVEKYLAVSHTFLNADVSGPIYEEAFQMHYKRLDDYRYHRASNSTDRLLDGIGTGVG